MSSNNIGIPGLTFEEMLATLTDSTSNNTTLNDQQGAGQPAYTGDIDHQQQAFITPQNNVANNFNFHTQRIENAYGNVTHNHQKAALIPTFSHHNDVGLELAINHHNERIDRGLRSFVRFQATPQAQQHHHGFQDQDVLINQLTANEAVSFLSPPLQPNLWAGHQENEFNFGAGGQGYPHYGPGSFDAFSSGDMYSQSNDTFISQPMRRINSTQQLPLTNDQAHQGMGMGTNEQYPAELPTSNALYSGQQTTSSLESSSQLARPSRRCRPSQMESGRHSMTFDELISPEDESNAAAEDQQLIILDSDSDEELSQLGSNTISQQPEATVKQRALPNWDPAINDINSAEAWLKAHPNQLYRWNVPGDDVDEVIRNKVYYAQQIFNALQAPPPPASPRKFDCQAAVVYHDKYHGKALKVIKDHLATPIAAKTTQSHMFKVVQMAIDVHLKGVPWSRFEKKTSMKLSPTNTEWKCSERLGWIIEAVSRVKTIGQDIVEWNPVQVEDIVGNAERILRAKVNSVPVNYRKSTKQHKEEFEEAQRRSQRRSARRKSQDAGDHDTSSRRPQRSARSPIHAAGTLSDVITIADDDNEDSILSSAASLSTPSRSKRLRPDEETEDNQPQVSGSRPQKRLRGPSSFSSSGNF